MFLSQTQPCAHTHTHTHTHTHVLPSLPVPAGCILTSSVDPVNHRNDYQCRKYTCILKQHGPRLGAHAPLTNVTLTLTCSLPSSSVPAGFVLTNSVDPVNHRNDYQCRKCVYIHKKHDLRADAHAPFTKQTSHPLAPSPSNPLPKLHSPQHNHFTDASTPFTNDTLTHSLFPLLTRPHRLRSHQQRGPCEPPQRLPVPQVHVHTRATWASLRCPSSPY